MAIKTCGFCGSNIEPGTGTIYVRRSGNIIDFCSRKCRVNMINLKRVPRRTKWTKEYHTIKSMRKEPAKPPAETVLEKAPQELSGTTEQQPSESSE
ncbi:MAG: 50S ribosomal protein L24e [Thermoplasmataceae archaeon]